MTIDKHRKHSWKIFNALKRSGNKRVADYYMDGAARREAINREAEAILKGEPLVEEAVSSITG